jgi:mRNA interferase MazF
MVMSRYPQQGDIVMTNFNPQSGHEQNGCRPALIISNNQYNQISSLVIACPITRTDKGFPLHLKLDGRTKTDGVVLCDQVKCIDPIARGITFIEKAPQDIIDEAIDIIMGIIERV